MLMGIPFEVLATFSLYPFPLPEFVCIMRHLLCECGCYASALTVTAFSVDRFLAVRTPVHMFLAAKRKRVTRICTGIWLVAFVVAAVFSAQFGILYVGVPSENCTIRRSTHCTLTLSREIQHSIEATSIIFFIIPGIVIAVLHVLIIVRLRSSCSVIGVAGGSAQMLKVTFPSPNSSHVEQTPLFSRQSASSQPIITSNTTQVKSVIITVENRSKYVHTQLTTPTSIESPFDTLVFSNQMTVPSVSIFANWVQSHTSILHGSLSSETSCHPKSIPSMKSPPAAVSTKKSLTFSESSASNDAQVPSDSVPCHATRNTLWNDNVSCKCRPSIGSYCSHRSQMKSPRKSLIDRRVQSANRVLGAT
jgi:hypothetical protein